MAKLIFKYSAMDAGKSTLLLQTSHNYNQGGLKTILYTAALDDRYETGEITSRIGLRAKANTFNAATNIEKDLLEKPKEEIDLIGCIMVDECQFLTQAQVAQLARIVDTLDIPVICHGLRTDFLGNLFEGSEALLAWADKLEEVKTICSLPNCRSKATMVIRTDSEGKVSYSGDQVSIGGNDTYKSVCRNHFIQALTAQKTQDGVSTPASPLV